MPEHRTIAIYQPYLFPYLGYWQLLDAADVFVIGDTLQFMARSFINRNTILLNHAPHRFSISLGKASPNRKISEIEIVDDFRGFRKMLHHAYGRSPHFDTTMNLIDQVLDHEDKNLARFAGNQIETLSRHMGGRAKVAYLSELGLPSDYTDKEQRLYDCVHALGGTRLVNPIGSAAIYRADDFSRQGIELAFLRSHTPAYPQSNRNFTPNLSIIDAMMNVSRDGMCNMLKRYDIVDASGSTAWT